MRPGLRVLAVDDMSIALDRICRLLRESSEVAEVRGACDPLSALKMVKGERFDAVFADISMPGLNGIELSTLLAKLADPPLIVFVTGYDEHAADAFDLGAVDYLRKPVSADRMSVALRRVIRRLPSAAITPDVGRPPKVFVAYAQDSQAHKDDIRGLADLLRSCGVDAEIDQYAEEERHDWNAWADKHLRESDFIVIVGSPKMGAVGDGNAPADQNRGVQAEMTVIRDFLQRDRAAWTKKILPVVLPGGTLDGLPDFLGPYSLSHYRVQDLTPAGIACLLRVITGQPSVVRPPLGQMPPLPPVAVERAAPAVPTWRVLPEPVPVMWRTAIMTTGNCWVPEWSATLEVHLVPLDGTARLPANRLRSIGGRFATVMRECGLVPTTEALQESRAVDVVQVSYYDSRTGVGAGLAVLRNGQRSAWRTLPHGCIGSVLIRDDAVATISTLVEVLLGLDDALPERFAPTVGIDPTTLVRIGERSDLTRNSASLPMAGTSGIRIGAEESLTVVELSRLTTAVAEEMVERVIAAFPRH